ncbi:MAG: glycosyl transferase, partial [Desulfobacteria bacterium]
MAKILAESFQAQLWTGHLDRESFPKGYFGNVEPGSLKAYENSPWWVGFSKIFQLWWAFAHFPERTVPWAIFSGSLSPLAHKKISGKKILYCLTPPRLLYDQKDFMVQQIPVWQRPLLKMVMGLYLPAYERATHSMDIIVTISETVRKRIRRFLRHDSQVIYPPCETERFPFLDQENFFLSTA